MHENPPPFLLDKPVVKVLFISRQILHQSLILGFSGLFRSLTVMLALAITTNEVLQEQQRIGTTRIRVNGEMMKPWNLGGVK